jgi:hypothetical protein
MTSLKKWTAPVQKNKPYLIQIVAKFQSPFSGTISGLTKLWGACTIAAIVVQVEN